MQPEKCHIPSKETILQPKPESSRFQARAPYQDLPPGLRAVFLTWVGCFKRFDSALLCFNFHTQPNFLFVQPSSLQPLSEQAHKSLHPLKNTTSRQLQTRPETWSTHLLCSSPKNNQALPVLFTNRRWSQEICKASTLFSTKCFLKTALS